jgi:hypothetical protein
MTKIILARKYLYVREPYLYLNKTCGRYGSYYSLQCLTGIVQ